MRTLTKLGTALLCAAAAAAATVVPATASTSPPNAAGPVLLDCQGHAQTEPATYVLACGDGNNYLTAIHWTAWTADYATATATDNANDCQPNCAAGRFHSYPVTVTLDQPRNPGGRPGITSYTQVTLHYTGAQPAGIAATISAPLPDQAS